ncbi:uncharacterized protein C7orf57-like isoform X2 [Antedon mediterranea]|uniref:uncharacterized protein C7orf57-like isoform X2 n=1 Tax=Antedon mediterranea TaxID=105859 RepID=UPI003AF9A82B
MSAGGGTQDRRNSEPVDYPAVSQIPGLSSLAQDIDDETGAKVGWIKETDTKYIRLAKMGGRKDLLRHRENKVPNSEAKAYPRCEWFDYVEYDGAEDLGPHQSYLPDYMVYKEFKTHEQPEYSQKPKRPPYSLNDNLSAFQRDGNTVTDKTIKLPEVDRQYKKGVVFKVRKDKHAGFVRPTEKGQRKNDKNKTGSSPPKEQNVTFSKLMSMSYQDEWLKQRQEEALHQQRMQEQQKNKDSSQNKNKITTEYREIICKDQQNQKTTSHSAPKIRHTKASEARKRRDSNDEKELFKLNRFTKVGAKVDSHWQNTDDSYSRQLAAVHI